MSAWAVDRADDLDGDDGVDVLIIPGMDLSLRQASSLTLLITLLSVLF